ncbi:aminodeoxychorismate synthase component I [Bacillus methanolicus]|uniref:anthranilate synthase component I family protein n=1 Tax=Bacillus methanolicus TaxID=1471 RepID=UPI00238093BD|nr:anthranilate synthase component I family protein [Bacillus methanolicus]MDE3840557.1 aminodeoxychorismate synthase component I [Bacillus methanolicus]
MKQLKIYSKKIPYSHSRFFKQYCLLSKDQSYHVFLESGRGGRYSIAGLQPYIVMEGKGSRLKIISKEKTDFLSGNPLHLLKNWLKNYHVEKRADLPDFQGGAIGYISYDYGRQIERLPNISQDDLLIPDIYFLLFKEWFVFDHEEKVLWLMFLYEEKEIKKVEESAKYWEQQWFKSQREEPETVNKKLSDKLEVSLTEKEFIEAVEKVQQYIRQGDVFQVNLSVRQSKPIEIPALSVYKQLRVLNPSPYMGYFHVPEFQLVSGSPELLVKKKGKEVSTRPIAGTRSRGKDDKEDLKLANELIENEKERAEHVMLVDLERNDLGRVCKYGTVEVNEFMVIEKYSHVMHIVSNVRGELEDNKDGFDLIDAVFPGGTITGAPKVRTMEIIEELEPVRRGPYTGSLGWIGFNGDLELNIIIRTMLVKDGMAHVQSGAGIVIDSNPKYEYKESLKKALALWKAKEQAEAAKGETDDFYD